MGIESISSQILELLNYSGKRIFLKTVSRIIYSKRLVYRPITGRHRQGGIERAGRLKFALLSLPWLANLLFQPLCWPQIYRNIRLLVQISVLGRLDRLSVRKVTHRVVLLLLLRLFSHRLVLLLGLRLRSGLPHPQLLTLRLLGRFQ